MNKMAEQISDVQTVVNSLNEIQEDASVPRNVRTQVQEVIGTLKDDTEVSIKVNKALNKLIFLNCSFRICYSVTAKIFSYILIAVMAKTAVKCASSCCAYWQ